MTVNRTTYSEMPTGETDTGAFRGPLFIVGMPRSGTKLLRDLLNRHSQIAIPPNESHFIPYFVANAGAYGRLTDRAAFDQFYDHISQGSFFVRLAARGQGIDRDRWFAEIADGSPAEVVEGLFRSFARQSGKRLYGDKTPSYMVHIVFLADTFPVAKFIHIVRDPRDYCLSIRKAWGKHMVRAAQRWNDDLALCRGDAATLAADRYLEVRYEDLLSDPERVLTRVCAFLEVAFERPMLSLERPAENLGDTKAAAHIVASNAGKWADALAERDILAIERVAGAQMACLGYEPRFVRGVDRVGRLQLLVYKMADGLNLLRYHLMKDKGLLSTLRLVAIERTQSAFRQSSR